MTGGSTGGGSLLASVERCTNHSFEIADRLCGDCGRPYCHLCLVSPFRNRPPLCLPCAVAASGIRRGAKQAPTRSKREIKALEKELRMAEGSPEPAAPSSGGFGPARPSISATPSAPAARPVRRSEPVGDQGATDGEDEDQRPRVPNRNRPLGGLARGR
jgi:hypothetical protein